MGKKTSTWSKDIRQVLFPGAKLIIYVKRAPKLVHTKLIRLDLVLDRVDEDEHLANDVG